MPVKSFSFLVMSVKRFFRQVAAITASGNFIRNFLRRSIAISAISSVSGITVAYPKNSSSLVKESLREFLKSEKFDLRDYGDLK